MTYTTNYELHKPGLDEWFDIADFNQNSDIIDTQMKTNETAIRYYGTCSTSRATNAKVVTCSDFVLETGCKIVVKFTDTAGAAPTEGNITLNINSTGAKNVYNKNNTQMSYAHSGEFRANRYCEFTYDGTNFIWLNYNSNTTYSTITQAEITAGTSTSSRLVTPKLLGDNFVKKESGKGLSTNDFTTTLKDKLDGIEDGAQVNTLTGVKGNSETTYRTGNVNITKANIGLGNVDNTADTNKSVASAGKWTTARDISISDSDGTNTGTAVSVDGSAAKTLKLPSTIKATLSGTATNAKSANNIIAYCSTVATTTAKLATLDGFILENGQRILLYLANENVKASATLNVNSTGDKAIKINGTTSVTTLNLPKGYYMAYYTVVSDVGYWYLYPILNLSTGTLFNGTSTGISTDANFGALGVKAWYFSTSAGYIVFVNGLKIQWVKYCDGFTVNVVKDDLYLPLSYTSPDSCVIIGYYDHSNGTMGKSEVGARLYGNNTNRFKAVTSGGSFSFFAIGY